MTEPSLAVTLGPLKLKSPVLAASGPFGSGLEYAGFLNCAEFGAIIVKGVSFKPWPGNPAPRLYETKAGLLNAIGLQNPGIAHFLTEELPRLRTLKTKIIVNIIGRSLEDYKAVATGLRDQAGICALELNISCPNVQGGPMAFGADLKLTEKVVSAVRQACDLPLIVKLTPNVTDIVAVARTAAAAGADIISLINTLGGMAIDIEKKRPVLGNIFGGLSGPAIMPVALKMVWQAAEALAVPVLGMGGITSAQDALQFILAGATAVAVGTGLFANPFLAAEINQGIKSYLFQHKISTVGELTGLARKGGAYHQL